jgi:hypothetical protein
MRYAHLAKDELRRSPPRIEACHIPPALNGVLTKAQVMKVTREHGHYWVGDKVVRWELTPISVQYPIHLDPHATRAETFDEAFFGRESNIGFTLAMMEREFLKCGIDEPKILIHHLLWLHERIVSHSMDYATLYMTSCFAFIGPQAQVAWEPATTLPDDLPPAKRKYPAKGKALGLWLDTCTTEERTQYENDCHAGRAEFEDPAKAVAPPFTFPSESQPIGIVP